MNERHHDPDDAADRSEAFRQRAGDLLRAAAQDVDARTASRLNRARQAALLQFPRRTVHWPAPWRLSAVARPAVAMPAVALVVVAVLAVALWPSQQPNQPPGQPPVTAASAVDMDLLLTDDSLEMFADLEFYAWLDADLSEAQLGAELESAS